MATSQMLPEPGSIADGKLDTMGRSRDVNLSKGGMELSRISGYEMVAASGNGVGGLDVVNKLQAGNVSI